MECSHEWNCTLDAILNHGTYLIVSQFGDQQQILTKTRGLLAEAAGILQGPEAGAMIARRGPAALHEVLPPEQIGPLRDFVMTRIRPDLLSFASAVGRRLLGMQGDFFVDDYTILRINYPYPDALRAGQATENPGIGRVDEKVRRGIRENPRFDPAYDPRGFHNNEPPAAWAHGVHQDTWSGHSRLGVNLWWAMDDIADECSMVLYPETFGRHFSPDPRSLYLKEGQSLPKPTAMGLRQGEMLVFNPEMLHGTRLNTSNTTRVALSARLNPRQPKFDPGCFYSREFWHSSEDIESGRLDRVIRFAREDNLETAPASAAAIFSTAQTECLSLGMAIRADNWIRVCASEKIAPFGKLLVSFADHGRFLLVRGERRLHAVQPRCAHLNVSMADGYHDNEQIWCPAHAVPFSLASGRSSCELLTLDTYEVREEADFVWLRLESPGRPR